MGEYRGMAMREREYLESVTETLGEMRTCFLGQKEKLSVALPEHLKNVSPEEKAAYVAHRLIFCLVIFSNEKRAEELQRGFKWLYSIILFLFEECPKEDHAFDNVIRISNLCLATRKCMFDDERYGILVSEEHSPELMEEYDLAVLHLLSAVHRTKASERRFREVKRRFYS